MIRTREPDDKLPGLMTFRLVSFGQKTGLRAKARLSPSTISRPDEVLAKPSNEVLQSLLLLEGFAFGSLASGRRLIFHADVFHLPERRKIGEGYARLT